MPLNKMDSDKPEIPYWDYGRMKYEFDNEVAENYVLR